MGSKPQIYVYVTHGGILGYEVTRGEVDVVSVDWDENTERTVADWEAVIATLQLLEDSEMKTTELEIARQAKQRLVAEQARMKASDEARQQRRIQEAKRLLEEQGLL